MLRRDWTATLLSVAGGNANISYFQANRARFSNSSNSTVAGNLSGGSAFLTVDTATVTLTGDLTVQSNPPGQSIWITQGGTVSLNGNALSTPGQIGNDGIINLQNGTIDCSTRNGGPGGRVRGPGTINGNLIIAAGATSQIGEPGLSATVSVNGDLTLEAGASSLFEITDQGNDFLAVSANASISGQLQVNFTATTFVVGQIHRDDV
ncbi:MAG: hypothetical protein HYX68_22040 [Planctomycetes bacterium]|nr:hypothetical protein [Planctomycetota bacterium]